MWTRLSDPDLQDLTGIAPGVIRHVRAPERSPQTIEDIGKDDSKGPADPLQMGRALAIARLCVFDEGQSAGLELLLGTAQRRRTVVGAHFDFFQAFGEEVLWKVPPYFRKPTKKKRSRDCHHVPCVGFAATAVRTLERIALNRRRELEKAGDPDDMKWRWLLPVSRPRRKGVKPKNPHADPSVLNDLLLAMPGVDFSPHQVRKAFATYGRQDLGWARGDAKLILDHMEGFDSSDVTAQHYDFDKEMLKKREMMKQWTDWVEQQAAKAVAADPTLLDFEVIGEQVYIIRYGEDAWKEAVAKHLQPWRTPAPPERFLLTTLKTAG